MPKPTPHAIIYYEYPYGNWNKAKRVLFEESVEATEAQPVEKQAHSTTTKEAIYSEIKAPY